MRTLATAIVALFSTIAPVLCQNPIPTSFRGSCLPITLQDLGSNETLSSIGLLPRALRDQLSVQEPDVRVFDFHVVCETAGEMRGTVSSVSLIVDFECRGAACRGVSPNNTVVNSTEQIQFNCTFSTFEVGNSPPFYQDFFLNGMLRTDNPTGTFLTPLDNRCGFCSDPTSISLPADPDTHCVGKKLCHVSITYVIIERQKFNEVLSIQVHLHVI